ncbi:MAG: TlpA family protein disulfide reductase [Pirellula sp.]|nr:TlpA family protein disulfide reductase [Pirellula sp.]
MYRFCILHVLIIFLSIFASQGSVLAQESDALSSNALIQKIEAKNSIAKFTVSLAPAKATVGEEVTLSIRAIVEKGWHIGATTSEADSIGFPTQIQFAPVGLEPIDDEFNSSTKPHRQKLDVGTQLLMDGEFTWSRRYKVLSENGEYNGSGSIRFQACDDAKCLPPQTVKFAFDNPASGDPHPATESAKSQTAGGVEYANEKSVGNAMVLSLEPCELTRTKPQIGNIVSLLLVGRQTERMVWKATITSGPDEGVNIYLPKARRYSLRNTGSDGTIVGNTATYVSVDQNGDGTLEGWEAAPVDRPIRIRDRMYRVSDINPKNKTLTLQQLDMPLKGSVVGYRCPDFEFTALDGSIISNKSILGKTTVLDIWAVSCHNCYEGFPKLQSALDKHTPDKLQIILMTVDTDRKIYDSQAPRLFETYGGGAWPQVMLPGGFDGALTIGDYGFGSVIVDPTGIVRAVGVYGPEVESKIDDVVKNAPQNAPNID